MDIKYLYLDDENLRSVRPYMRHIVDVNKQLTIKHLFPVSYDAQIDFIYKENFDGLILDWRLDQAAGTQDDGKKTKARYRAAALAQELRTRAAEGGRDFPIILWSTDDKLKQSYSKDDTSHDLFDLKCIKGEIIPRAKEISAQLISLAEGYKTIVNTVKAKQTRQLLAFEDLTILDPRILAYLDELSSKRAPAHEYARFIIKELLETSGPLIDEKTLAARLGIDMNKSKDWSTLLSKLKKAGYQGVFKDGWQRWWASSVETWWDGLGKSVNPLRSVPAEERVSLLQKRFKLQDLIKSEPIRPEYSQAYWTICQVTQKPLDPRDGFILDVETKLWQSKAYVSGDAELKKERRRKGLRLDPLELERASRLKKAA
jgi:hypothetical protein